MSERPDAGAAEPVSLPQTVDPRVPTVPYTTAPHLPSLLPDVSQVLLQRAATPEPAADGRERGESSPDPVARRLNELTAGLRPAFPIAVSHPRPAVAAAAACPDLFLLDVRPDHRVDVTTEVIEVAVRHGQRVLVIAPDADQLTQRLTDRLGSIVARAVGSDELAVTGPTAAALAADERATTRDQLTTEIQQLTEQLTAAARWEALAAEEATVGGELERERATLTRELGEMRQQAAQPTGFFKRLFGSSKPGELTAKVAELEARLHDLDTAPPVRERLSFIEKERATLTPPVAPAERLRSELTHAQNTLAEIDARPPVLSAERKEQLRVVVGPPPAVGFDPLLSASHPEVAARFDRVVWADAAGLDDHEFHQIARLGSAWVLIASPAPADPAALRNGVYGSKSRPMFATLWDALHDDAWTAEGDCPLVRLLPVPPDRRPHLTCEPLFGRPDVEVRFTDTETGPELAEVRFPSGMSVAEAKAFLAAESGEVRMTPVGLADWHETPDAITCRWPLVEPDPTTDSAELGDGVCERACRVGWTAAVSFAAAAGWTRQTASDWLAARTPTTAPRTAAVR